MTRQIALGGAALLVVAACFGTPTPSAPPSISSTTASTVPPLNPPSTGSPSVPTSPMEPPVEAPSVAVGVPEPIDDRCLDPNHTPEGWTPSPVVDGGSTRIATAVDGRFVVHTVGGDRAFLPGVNLGSALPGSGPNDWSIDGATYRRWIERMAEIGLRAVRVYDRHPAAFYDALAAHNLADPERAIYLLQGVWFPEQRFAASRDLFDVALTAEMDRLVDDTVAAVAGTLAGDAHDVGREAPYTSDVTPWLVGVVVGIEWDPVVIRDSDAANRQRGGFQGSFVAASADASPTERWLAARLDRVAEGLASRGVGAPLSFTNWITTDPLDHPTEELVGEDLVGIDATHVEAVDWPAGVFATYHAYPHYPNFQETEPGIADVVFDGVVDPYVGYLLALSAHHGDQPIVIGEVGASGGWSTAGEGPNGRHHGGHTETSQMAINANFVEAADAVGLGGLFLFSWADEWFKATWNLIGLEGGAASRAAWHNLLSAEQHFGLLAVEPVGPVLDGVADEWRDSEPLEWRADPSGILVRIRADAPRVELRIDTDTASRHPADPVDPASEVRITITDRAASIHERSAIQPRTTPLSAAPAGDRLAIEAGPSGAWERFGLLDDFATDTRPASVDELARLPRSAADGEGTVPHQTAGWARRGATIELRIPWTLLHVVDPVEGVGARVRDGSVEQRPSRSVDLRVVIDDRVVAEQVAVWEPWQTVEWTERLKDGTDVLAAALCRVTDR